MNKSLTLIALLVTSLIVAQVSYSQDDSDGHRLLLVIQTGNGNLGNKQSGHLFGNGFVGHGFDITNNNASALVDPEDRGQASNAVIYGGAPASRYFIAGYIDAPTTTSPIPVTPNGQSFWLDVDSTVTGGDPFGSTGAIEVYGSAYVFSDSIYRATYGWKKLRYTERNAFASDDITAASTGYVISATGNYHYNVQGLKYLFILADDIGSITAAIGGTLTNFTP